MKVGFELIVIVVPLPLDVRVVTVMTDNLAIFAMLLNNHVNYPGLLQPLKGKRCKSSGMVIVM